MLPKKLPAKTVFQKVRAKILWKSVRKTTTGNDRTEMLPKYISAKTVVHNVPTEMLAENASEKFFTYNDRTEMLLKNLPQKLSFKMSVPQF